MPGLVRGVARTAVIAGTATAVSNRVSRRQAGRWAAQEQTAGQQQQAVNAQVMPSTEPQPDKLAQLRELGQLRDQGVLTPAEFEAEKYKVLAS
jgi:Short C-terminal domain